MVCRLTEKPIGSDRINGYDKKEKLCELIRKLMDPAVTAGEAPKFTVHYPTVASSASVGGASGGAGSASAASSVNTAEDDATAAELVAKDAEIAELRAQITALQGKLTKVSLAMDD
jgi:hypothetical protein